MDFMLLLIGGLLAVTLIAFFVGATPYPIGWLVLLCLLVLRLNRLKRPNNDDI